jgi:transposase
MIETKYVAFDVHKATISVAVLNLDGKLVTQAVIHTEASAIRDFLRGLGSTVHLTFEEGSLSQWLYDLARPLVSELMVCNAKDASSVGNKSDKVDALRLAHYLRAGLLKSVYHGSAPTQTLKQLTHIYDSITSDTTRCMNRLKSLYTSLGIACSGRDVYYTRNRGLWLDKVAQGGHRLRAEFLYRQLDHLRPLKEEARKAMVKEARRHAAFKKLKQVPGLGPVRVAEIISAVGSPHRFRTKRQLWKYCGLAVVTRSSSDYEVVEEGLRRRANNTRTRGLNREYNRRLKRVFKSGAVEALKDEAVKKIYQSLTSKGVRAEMALLTIARKLAAVSLAMWKSGEDYDEGKLTRLAA